MPNNKNTIDALIFLGVARAKVQLKKAIKAGNTKNSKIKLGFEFYLDGNLRNPKNSFLPRANEIHGVPAFKKSCIRELIYQIADNNFWHQYYKGFRYNIVEGAYKSKLHSPDMDSAIQQSVIFKFNFAPDIKISTSSIKFDFTAASIFFFILLPIKAIFLLFFFAALTILIIRAMFEEKHVTTILLIYLEKTFFNSSLTSSSEEEKPGTSALVESPIKANTP